MNKKEFLKSLEAELINNKCTEIKSILEYYEELIEDQIEAGVKPKDIFKKLDITNIVKNIKLEQKVEAAANKPSVSNGIKATLATLSILSLPLLIPIGVVVLSIIIVILSVLFSLIVTVGALILAGGLSIIALIWGLFTGELTVAATVFSLGVSLILLGLGLVLLKWVIAVTKEFVTWLAEKLRNKIKRRKEKKSHE